MTNAFAMRKPWVAALIGLFLGPFAGMLYLNRGKIALLYLFGSISIGLVLGALTLFKVLNFDLHSAIIISTIPFVLIGANHCYLIAKSRTAEALAWYAHWYSIALLKFVLPLVLVLSAIPLRLYGYEPFYAASASMEPTLYPDDYFIVNKHKFNSAHLPQRGDIIVFNVQDRVKTIQYVKRIIGLPGDKIQIDDEGIQINGSRMLRQVQRNVDGNLEYVETLPEGKQFYIFQNRPDVDNTELSAKTFEVPADQYFVLGDNRSHSLDSSNRLGFVASSDIKGRPIAVIWNMTSHKFSFSTIK